jgi:hypothetical protein
MPTLKQCYQCGNDNPDQGFCGVCGSPLALNDYLSKKVKDQVAETIENRDVLEMDSSIRVFKQAWEWIRLIIGIAVGLLVLVGGGVIWRASDFWASADKAKQSVTDTAKKSSDEIARSSAQSKQEISSALEAGKAAITTAASDASRQSQVLKDATIQAQSEITRQKAALQSDVENSRHQLQAAGKIQPEMEDMRKQLAKATSDMQAQQKVISSSEEFVKQVFSSHAVEMFNIGRSPKDRYAIITPPSKEANSTTVVMLLLSAAPIQGTLQLQYHIYLQPPGSYFNIHNLVLFFWSDAAEKLQQNAISVSYFPDKSDKEVIHALSEHDGRMFADDQPLPKFGQADPDFKGNKWMQYVNPPKP